MFKFLEKVYSFGRSFELFVFVVGKIDVVLNIELLV